MFRKIISGLIIFSLVLQQSSFAQVAPNMGVPMYLQGLLNAERFRPVHLRSVSFDATSGNYKLLLDKGDTKELSSEQAQEQAKKLLEYFKIGLTLPNSMFWVNLRPDDPSNIIDPYLEQTDLGKVLLEADLELKKDMSLFTSPDTKEGKAYWDKLYSKAEALYGSQDIEVPTVTRPWIVPGEIIIGESPEGAYIYKATLKVMLEQDWLGQRTAYSGQRTGKAENQDPRQEELNQYSTELIKQQILPKLTREINSSKKYASLRQVYYSLILAQYWKNKGKIEPSPLFDSKNLTGLTSTTTWNKDAYYQAYRKSFSQGEYNKEETVQTANGITVRQYFSGGIQIVDGGSVTGLLTNKLSGIKDTISVEIPDGGGQEAAQRYTGTDIEHYYTILREGGIVELLELRRSLAQDITADNASDMQFQNRLIDLKLDVGLKINEKLEAQLNTPQFLGRLTIQNNADPFQSLLEALGQKDFFAVFKNNFRAMPFEENEPLLYVTLRSGEKISVYIDKFNAQEHRVASVRVEISDGGIAEKILNTPVFEAALYTFMESLAVASLFSLASVVASVAGISVLGEYVSAVWVGAIIIMVATVFMQMNTSFTSPTIGDVFVRLRAVLSDGGNRDLRPRSQQDKSIMPDFINRQNIKLAAYATMGVVGFGSILSLLTRSDAILLTSIVMIVAVAAILAPSFLGQFREFQESRDKLSQKIERSEYFREQAPKEIDVVSGPADKQDGGTKHIFGAVLNLDRFGNENLYVNIRRNFENMASQKFFWSFGYSLVKHKEFVYTGESREAFFLVRSGEGEYSLAAIGIVDEVDYVMLSRPYEIRLGVDQTVAEAAFDYVVTNRDKLRNAFSSDTTHPERVLLGAALTDIQVKGLLQASSAPEEIRAALENRLNVQDALDELTRSNVSAAAMFAVNAFGPNHVISLQVENIKGVILNPGQRLFIITLDSGETFEVFIKEVVQNQRQIQAVSVRIADGGNRDLRPRSQQDKSTMPNFMNKQNAKFAILAGLGIVGLGAILSCLNNKDAIIFSGVLIGLPVALIMSMNVLGQLREGQGIVRYVSEYLDRLIEKESAPPIDVIDRTKDKGDGGLRHLFVGYVLNPLGGVFVDSPEEKVEKQRLAEFEAAKDRVDKYHNGLSAGHYNYVVVIDTNTSEVVYNPDNVAYEGFAREDIPNGKFGRYMVQRVTKTPSLMNMKRLIQAGLEKKVDGGDKMGGVDFRAMPLTMQPGMALGVATPKIDLKALGILAQNSRIVDLDKEWANIEKQICNQKMPYQRIKEYAAVCLAKKDKHLDKVADRISDILKMEEAAAVQSAPELKEILQIASVG